ncbi:Uu.00g007920.m01.CDS01 [Anthostomella pinea]|uniref:Uu.00g007920.m01.CDS01 n=1 Tax=Anthostomella pinea TaxID=933095 RepID=A0AAI8VYB7_9PEZI|nr:Uu.00g007920.m01.CDS01 [Anthostomella pinea]
MASPAGHSGPGRQDEEGQQSQQSLPDKSSSTATSQNKASLGNDLGMRTKLHRFLGGTKDPNVLFRGRNVNRIRNLTMHQLYAQGLSPPVSEEYLKWHMAFYIWSFVGYIPEWKKLVMRGDKLDKQPDSETLFPFIDRRPGRYEKPYSQAYADFWDQVQGASATQGTNGDGEFVAVDTQRSTPKMI